MITRRMQSFGREELANPVAEAIRKCSQEHDKTCETCEYYKDENDDGYALNWCYENNTSTNADDYCDKYKEA